MRLGGLRGGGLELAGALALAVVLVLVLALALCASAQGATAGFLYTAVGSSIDTFAVGADTSLTYQGATPGGAVTPYYAGSVVMARTADGENLYELSGTGTSQTIYQYSVDPTTGAVTAKSPATVGPVPQANTTEGELRLLGVFNPAATGAAGQNALYVLSQPSASVAAIEVFDIDATTGALTQAAEVGVTGVSASISMGYSGATLVVNGVYEFASATIDPTTGLPVFDPTTEAPCSPYPCSDGTMYVMDPDHLLTFDNDIPNPNSMSDPVGSGVEAFEPHSFAPLGGTITEPRYGPRDITSNGTDYFVTEADTIETDPTYGDSWWEEFDPDGLSDGYTQLPSGSSPGGIFSLGSGLYIADENSDASGFDDGLAYALSPGSPPQETTLSQPLGDSMTGFLIGSGGGGAGGGGAGGGGAGGGGGGTGGAPTSYTLSVALKGTGKGGVKGSGIACPGTCSATLAAGTKVTLTEKPLAGSKFAGWSGACTGVSATCALTISAAQSVSAAFTKIGPPKTTITKIKLSGQKVKIHFQGSGGSGKLTFRCKLGSGKAKVCGSPKVYKHLVPGKHKFSVTAVDSLGVADPTPAKVTFIVK